jgi:hypothetical protein
MNDIEKHLDEAINDDNQRLRRFDIVKRVIEQPEASNAKRKRSQSDIDKFDYLKQEYKGGKYAGSHFKQAIEKWVTDKSWNERNERARRYNPAFSAFSLSEPIDFEYEPTDTLEATDLGTSLEIDESKRHLQDVNVRVLGSGSDVEEWKNRNINERRHLSRGGIDDSAKRIVRGEYLNLNDDAWTDYINQGWMQKGYERGAMFRLLTSVPQEIVDMHNEAASNGAWEEYETRMTDYSKKNGLSFWSSSNQRRTFFAQELVDAARAGYTVQDDNDNQNQKYQTLMPRLKSQLLKEISDQGRQRALTL